MQPEQKKNFGVSAAVGLGNGRRLSTGTSGEQQTPCCDTCYCVFLKIAQGHRPRRLILKMRLQWSEI
jgi:hypothetical protein